MKYKNIARFAITAISLFSALLSANLSFASLGARPAYLFVDLDKSNPSGTFTVTNMSDEAQTYRASAIHFEITEAGSVKPVPPDDYSLAEWIKFNPKEFTLEPKSSREIRFTIVRQRNLKHREYWGAIEFMPLKGMKYGGNTDASGRKMQFEVLTALMIPIYGSTSGIGYSGKILDITAERVKDKTGFTALVENTGQGVLRLRGEIEIFNPGISQVALTAPVNIFNVLPNQRRRIKFLGGEQLPGGQYAAQLRLKQEKPEELILSHQQDFKLR